MRTKITLATLVATLFASALLAQKITTPPVSPVRSMAEWEELQALVITWNDQNHGGTWIATLAEITRAAREECRVVICCNSASIVTSAQSFLTDKGVDISSNVEFVVAPNNSIWVRDYGPNCVYSNEVDSLFLVDWRYNRVTRPKDDTISTTLAPYFGLPLYTTTVAPADLVNTGGNFMSDGLGTAFASSLVLDENEAGNPYNASVKTEAQIDGILSDFMGIERYIKMGTLPYDQIHHIDMHMKLLDEETLLVGQYPEGMADGPQIEANIQYVLSNFLTPFGTPYKLLRIPMPPENGQFPNTGGDYRTYANAVFVNKTIIVPFYEQQFDTIAQRIWETAMPGYKIVGVNSNATVTAFGAIHCITKEIGVADPLRIVHDALECQDNSLVGGAYSVMAHVQHRSGVAGVELYYATNPAGPWQSVEMHEGFVPNGDWFGAIPAQAVGATVYYYIEAAAVSGKTITRPMTAPEGWWKFCVTQSSGTETPVSELLDLYPNPASAITVIPVSSSEKTRGNILVYNSLGQLMKEVFAGEIPSGHTNYFLDAGQLTPGTYFVKLQTGGQVRLKKLVVR